MRIAEVYPQTQWVLRVVAEDGRMGYFDVSPYLEYEAFEELVNHREFMKITNGKYFVEWDCGADLSVDTIEAQWEVVDKVLEPTAPMKAETVERPELLYDSDRGSYAGQGKPVSRRE